MVKVTILRQFVDISEGKFVCRIENSFNRKSVKMSEFGKDEKDAQPKDEEKQRPSSSLPSIMSRTNSPAQLQDDVLQEETCVTREEDLAGIEVSTGYLSADVSAREMVQERAFTASPCVRVMLRENSELEIDHSETSLKTAEGGEGSEQAGEGLDQTPGEVYFFNKKSTARRVKQITHKLSGQERCSAKLRPVDTQGDPDNVEQTIMNLRQTPDESPKLKQTEYSERNSPTHLPLSTSSSSPVEEEVQENTKREKTRANTSNATTKLVSVFTQTEWSWFNDMLQYQEMMTKAETAVRTKEIPNSPSGNQLTATYLYMWIIIIMIMSRWEWARKKLCIGKYCLLLTEFRVCTVSYRLSSFLLIYGRQGGKKKEDSFHHLQYEPRK